MTDLETRVARCFANAFPDLAEDKIPSISQSNLSSWDSVAHITLIASLSEEFGLDLDLESPDEFASFASVVNFLQAHT